jgi:hypothetical protein
MKNNIHGLRAYRHSFQKEFEGNEEIRITANHLLEECRLVGYGAVLFLC